MHLASNVCIQLHLHMIYIYACVYTYKLHAYVQDLGDVMASFLVNVATAKLCEGDVNPELPQGCKKIKGASINLSFGSVGYTHFLAQFCERVSSTCVLW